MTQNIPQFDETEIDDSVETPDEYGEKRTPLPPLARVKVWNPDPRDKAATPTPGLVIRVRRKEGEEWVTSKEVVPSIKAVILFSTYARHIKTYDKKNGVQVPCCSFNGLTPAVRIDKPLCRESTADDLVKIIGGWKGMDKAKIDAKIKETTEGTGRLQVCALKAANGHIKLCPYSKPHPLTKAKAPCVEFLFVHGYDIERNQEFVMELTGRSMQNGGKFRAPIHDFYASLKGQGPERNGKRTDIPPYYYTVELSAAPNDAFYYLNVKGATPIPDKDKRTAMRDRATAARDRYEKNAARLSDEAYKRQKEAEKAQAPAAAPAKELDKDDDIPFGNDTLPEVKFDDSEIPA